MVSPVTLLRETALDFVCIEKAHKVEGRTEQRKWLICQIGMTVL